MSDKFVSLPDGEKFRVVNLDGLDWGAFEDLDELEYLLNHPEEDKRPVVTIKQWLKLMLPDLPDAQRRQLSKEQVTKLVVDTWRVANGVGEVQAEPERPDQGK